MAGPSSAVPVPPLWMVAWGSWGKAVASSRRDPDRYSPGLNDWGMGGSLLRDRRGPRLDPCGGWCCLARPFVVARAQHFGAGRSRREGQQQSSASRARVPSAPAGGFCTRPERLLVLAPTGSWGPPPRGLVAAGRQGLEALFFRATWSVSPGCTSRGDDSVPCALALVMQEGEGDGQGGAGPEGEGFGDLNVVMEEILVELKKCTEEISVGRGREAFDQELKECEERAMGVWVGAKGGKAKEELGGQLQKSIEKSGHVLNKRW